jgi:hypothetical protein
MIRITPFRLTTLQCSQIGFTLVRTFTKSPETETKNSRGDPNSNQACWVLQVRE